MFGTTPKTCIRSLVVLNILLFSLGIWLVFFNNPVFLKDLRELIDLANVFLVFIFVLFFIFTYIGAGGLFFLKEWSRWVYSLSSFVGYILSFYLIFPDGDEAVPFFESVTSELTTLTDGAILALIWSPIWKQVTDPNPISRP